jgi:cytoskeletal protein CcmA (bactofilin family)
MQHFGWLGLAGCLALAGCGVGGPNGDVTAGQSGANTVNGSIRVPAGLHSGAVGTVNGSIDVEDNAVVAEAGTVNGSIELGEHASADRVSTVNGGVTLEPGAHVAHSVMSVNGGMNLKSGADVGGAVGNVNGHIRLMSAHVAGGLRTVSGDIDINGNSRVEDGILVKRASMSFFNFYSRKPRIVIGPGAVVEGKLRFEREVQLYVSDKATVGPIEGAKAVPFTGDTPPG